MVKAPRGTATAPPSPLSKLSPQLGLAPESKGGMVPYELIGPIIEAKVGQMKAEFERDFQAQLGKIDNLPTKWQLIAGAASGVVITIGLLFGVLAYFGDRQDNSIERSATISQSLTRIEGKIEAAPKPETKPSGK